MDLRQAEESEMTNNNGLTASTSLQMKFCSLSFFFFFFSWEALFSPNEAGRLTRGRKIEAFSEHCCWINYVRQNKASLSFNSDKENSACIKYGLTFQSGPALSAAIVNFPLRKCWTKSPCFRFTSLMDASNAPIQYCLHLGGMVHQAQPYVWFTWYFQKVTNSVWMLCARCYYPPSQTAMRYSKLITDKLTCLYWVDLQKGEEVHF